MCDRRTMDGKGMDGQQKRARVGIVESKYEGRDMKAILDYSNASATCSTSSISMAA